MVRLAKAWPCAASAMLLLLAFPPFNLSLLVFVALTPWLLSLKEEGARGFRSGYMFGFLYMLGQMFWEVPFVSRWTGSIPLACIPWILSGLLTATYFGIGGWLTRICWQRNWAWAIPLVWTGVEVFRSYIPGLAFPWGLLATPLCNYPPLMGLAHYGLIYLASAWCVVPSLLLAQFLGGAKVISLRHGILVFVIGIAASLLYWNSPEVGTVKTIYVAQPGVDLAFGDPATEHARVAAALGPLFKSAKAAKADLMVLPEGIGGTMVGPPFPAIESMEIFRDRADVPILYGGNRGESPRYQTAFGYDGQWSFADKTRLVIFGEFVPGRSWFPYPASFKLPSGDLDAATVVSTVHVNGMAVGPLLCFEELFPDLAIRQRKQGAGFLAVMSIDDWYMGTAAPEQLAAAAPWRAVEAGIPVVRSASTGITMAADARGNVLGAIPIGESRGIVVRITIPADNPRFLPAGLFPILALLSLIVVPVANRFRR